MKKKLQTTFSTRQYMLSDDFEIFYYNDTAVTNVKLHTHNYYEFYIFLEGHVSLQIGETVLPLQFGDIILIPPRLLHRAVIHDTALPYRRFVFWISMEYHHYLDNLSPDYTFFIQHVETTQNYLFHNDRITFNSIQSKIIRLIDEIKSDRFGRTVQITLCVNDLILYLNRVLHEQNKPKHFREEITLYQRICDYIEENINHDLSLERLAAEFFISKYHIAHIFKENIGISLHQFITKKRLALCQSAILSDVSITAAYRMAGFGDYSSFYRAFKKEYGLSPKEFQNLREGLTPFQKNGMSLAPLETEGRFQR